LGLDGDVPDHSTFSKNRHGRFRESDLLRRLFETVVVRCISEGLVGGEAFAADASMIVADAHRRRGLANAGELDPAASRAVVEYLAVVDDAAFGEARPVEPKFVSPTDPAARHTAAANAAAVYGPRHSQTEAYIVSRRERKKVEMLFAHLKRILKLDRLRLCGPNGARDEFLLAAAAQNLREMAKLLPASAPDFTTGGSITQVCAIGGAHHRR
jgi:hypothetical protein